MPAAFLDMRRGRGRGGPAAEQHGAVVGGALA